MTVATSQYLDVDCLQVGHFVCIDLGWTKHPFPLNSFKINSAEQIATIRSLGIKSIRFDPERSDLRSRNVILSAASLQSAPIDSGSAPDPATVQRRQLLAQQRAGLQLCERQFGNAINAYRQLVKTIHTDPSSACDAAESLAESLVGQLGDDQETCIRLLSEKVGERPSLHAINVAILSLLLGKFCGCDQLVMKEICVAALLHDCGKFELPDRLRHQEQFQSSAEQRLFEEHVKYGVSLARRMGVSPGAMLIIGQHHECADGTGYPAHMKNDSLLPGSRIVGLVNRFDNLCNPSNPTLAMTPHEALAQLFAQAQAKFDLGVLNSFVRMMGVYPPGSFVQLNDERYALVVSVNSSRPLKPRIIVHDAGILPEEALIIDLEREPTLGIRSSLKPLQLPKASVDYLSPRQRVSYFFEDAECADEKGLVL